MPRSTHTPTRTPSRTARRGRSTLIAAVAGIALVAIGASAALAGGDTRAHAAGSTRVLGTAGISTLGKTVVVDARGRTLYALHPETAHHLLCKSHACLEFWPPLLVHSASAKLSAPSGVSGHVGVIRRGAGKFQVTLRGLPLYRFSGDHAKGEANGEGIKSFGGTWHVIAVGAPAAAPQPSAPAPMPVHYGY